MASIKLRSHVDIGLKDLQIAPVAIANNLTLITHNISEFSRVMGLTWEDWEN